MRHFFHALTFLIIHIGFYKMDVSAQTRQDNYPMIGAEIFIEPGQTKAEIDTWFQRMSESGMTITRIRMFENYMHDGNGNWDFQLFDRAFKAAEKYGVKIYANLFPATPFDDLGGFKFPGSDEHLGEIADYIKRLVLHFRQYKSLYGWVPVNEPGVNGYMDDHPFTGRMFAKWKGEQRPAAYDSKGFVHFDFAKEKFLVHYNTWFLQWLTNEIHRHDPGRPVHVNNHDIFRNVAEYDFPAWRRFLTSLGGSAHASWHFSYFRPDQYALAVDANSEIIRSGAGQIPWMMTELQGGNNTYSGYEPMCPTPEEITQWLWITTAAQSKGSIFWCLNPRASGIEAGEWALLDFQNRPSDRMLAAARVARTLKEHGQLFAGARTVESGVNLLYIRESMWVESKLLSHIQEKVYEARMPGAVMKSVLAYHEALSQMGVQTNVREIGEFDFSAEDYTGSTLILAHQVAIPSRYWDPIKQFVQRGGKLIVEGLSGYYDENAVCVMRTGFPFEELFGGNVSEFRFVGNKFAVQLGQPGPILPVHAWQGYIYPLNGAVVIASHGGKPVALRNGYGKGKVLWIPSLLGLGARISGDFRSLCALLKRELSLDGVIRFSERHPGMLMKTLQSADGHISVLINKNNERQTVTLVGVPDGREGSILFSNKSGFVSGMGVTIDPEETMVVQW